MRTTRIRTRLAAGVLAASALLFASACNSDSDSASDSTGTLASDSTGPQAPGSAKPSDGGKPADAGTSPTKPAGKTLTQDQLAAAVLTETELNTGTDYEKDAPDPKVLGGKETAVRPECQPFVDLALPGNGKTAPAAGIKAGTSRGATTVENPFPASIDIVELYAFGPGEAASLLTKGRTALATCKDIDTTDEQGPKSTMTYTRADGPKLGDDALAVHGLIEDGGVTSAVIVRVGAHLVIVSKTDLGGSTPVLPDTEVVRKQVTKLEAAVRA
ncbi:hypothetical protein [Embleya sp. NBC_00896]|uniref:hypothetical protein n=1 Tax=Embleya sp. NBC_00896 TaxID=2975961 RepID=UPI002F91AA13|nr:hypothetical protein OG928_40350 [Embleya sp. NBC_00896]